MTAMYIINIISGTALMMFVYMQYVVIEPIFSKWHNRANIFFAIFSLFMGINGVYSLVPA